VRKKKVTWTDSSCTALDNKKLFYSNLHFTDLSAILVIYGQNVSLSKLQLKFIQTKAWVVVDYWWTKKKKKKEKEMASIKHGGLH
jgi:hypothetical protein